MSEHNYPKGDYFGTCKSFNCRVNYLGPEQSCICYACFKAEQAHEKTEIETLYEQLEELDRQAFKNYVETQEIVQRIRELGREVPENKMKGEM